LSGSRLDIIAKAKKREADEEAAKKHMKAVEDLDKYIAKTWGDTLH
jgi:hypothetical protein